ncbi:DUF2797 domain-containing protein [Planomonospora sp. ID82291]|uniref:DUF2797 domain-containing protein n=1 Tax=Planomonospora sp. ID82291 TaxID=2738136 RepID=UPI0018C437DD|nr:DUF2797 domain-containing protein [Planomonospora sp. ID82291]
MAWLLSSPRVCVGVWTGATRTPCPAGTPVPPGTDAQCAGCAAADRGRALARDAILGGDDRDWHLYLAWFGSGLLKVGLTAEDRGDDRLLEQGAIAWTLLAGGRYAAIRRAEQTVSAAGLARERIGARAKADAWWVLPGAGERAEHVEKAHAAVTAAVTWPAGVTPTGCNVHDAATVYGLDEPPPAAYQELTGVDDAAVLAGRIRAAVGRRLLIDTPAGPLLADMRRIAGLPLAAAAGDARPAGLHSTSRMRPHPHGNDQRLF